MRAAAERIGPRGRAGGPALSLLQPQTRKTRHGAVQRGRLFACLAVPGEATLRVRSGFRGGSRAARPFRCLAFPFGQGSRSEARAAPILSLAVSGPYAKLYLKSARSVPSVKFFWI